MIIRNKVFCAGLLFIIFGLIILSPVAEVRAQVPTPIPTLVRSTPTPTILSGKAILPGTPATSTTGADGVSGDCSIFNLPACFAILLPSNIMKAVIDGLGQQVMGLVSDFLSMVEGVMFGIIGSLADDSGNSPPPQVTHVLYTYDSSGMVHLSNQSDPVSVPACAGGDSSAMGIMKCTFKVGTASKLTYDSVTIKDWQNLTREIAFAMLGFVAMWAFWNVVTSSALGENDYTASEYLPRIVMGACGILAFPYLCKFVIDLNTLMSNVVWFHPESWPSIPNAANNLATTFDLIQATSIFLMIFVILMAGILFLQIVMRLAIINVLLVLAPLAPVFWILPQTQSIYKTWLRGFVSTVFVEFVQVLTLRIGFSMAMHLYDLGTKDSMATISAFITTLVIIWTTIKIPGWLSSFMSDASLMGAAMNVKRLAMAAIGIMSGVGVGAVALGAAGSAASISSGGNSVAPQSTAAANESAPSEG